MGLPEEDRGPAWLRDWGRNTGYTSSDPMSGWVDSNALAVDIQDLLAFSSALQTEHTEDYQPHLSEVFGRMATEVPNPDQRFIELTEAMTHHRDMLIQASTTLKAHDNAVVAFAEAAKTIGESYRGADELTAARVGDVEANLGGVQQPAAPVTPEEAAATTPEAPPSETGDSPDGGSEVNG